MIPAVPFSKVACHMWPSGATDSSCPPAALTLATTERTSCGVSCARAMGAIQPGSRPPSSNMRRISSSLLSGGASAAAGPATGTTASPKMTIRQRQARMMAHIGVSTRRSRLVTASLAQIRAAMKADVERSRRALPGWLAGKESNLQTAARGAA
jgi:hypothetical protein